MGLRAGSYTDTMYRLEKHLKLQFSRRGHHKQNLDVDKTRQAQGQGHEGILV